MTPAEYKQLKIDLNFIRNVRYDPLQLVIGYEIPEDSEFKTPINSQQCISLLLSKKFSFFHRLFFYLIAIRVLHRFNTEQYPHHERHQRDNGGIERCFHLESIDAEFMLDAYSCIDYFIRGGYQNIRRIEDLLVKLAQAKVIYNYEQHDYKFVLGVRDIICDIYMHLDYSRYIRTDSMWHFVESFCFRGLPHYQTLFLKEWWKQCRAYLSINLDCKGDAIRLQTSVQDFVLS